MTIQLNKELSLVRSACSLMLKQVENGAFEQKSDSHLLSACRSQEWVGSMPRCSRRGSIQIKVFECFGGDINGVIVTAQVFEEVVVNATQRSCHGSLSWFEQLFLYASQHQAWSTWSRDGWHRSQFQCIGSGPTYFRGASSYLGVGQTSRPLYSGFLKICASRPFASSHQRFFFSRTSRIILGSTSFVVLILIDLLTASIEKVWGKPSQESGPGKCQAARFKFKCHQPTSQHDT